MIALGGAIGTGLFYGSAEAIQMAGPSILLAYLIGGVAIYIVMRALGEMSVHTPVAGAFSHFAYTHWSERAGFVSGWNYWFNYIAVAMAELSIVGLYVNYWWPTIPTWLSAAFFLVVITAINLVSVKAFGEFEFWFAAIKVVAIVGMIALGVIVVVCGLNSDAPAMTESVREGGFFPFGFLSQNADGAWVGIATALTAVMFSFGGVELVGITAGEADNPSRSIPRAINQVIYRILIFYVAALAVIMAVVPWTTINGQMSPFVQIFDSVGIKAAAGILNFVCLTAAMSVYNSGLYSNGRMLYALAKQGNAPRFLARLSPSGAPYLGILLSAGITVIAVVIAFVAPQNVFSTLMSIALVAGVINWVMILITQWKFRRHASAETIDGLAFKMPGAPFTTWIVIAFFVGVVALMVLTPQYRPAVYVGPIWLAVLLVAYEIKKRTAHSRENA
jgi:L-asparagine transporter-like permease